MKKIINILLTLVLCVGLFAALGVSASAAEEGSIAKKVTFSKESIEKETQKEEAWFEGCFDPRQKLWRLVYDGTPYTFAVHVPDYCQLTKVIFELGWPDCWPSVSCDAVTDDGSFCGTVTKSGSYGLTVTFDPEDNVHFVILNGAVCTQSPQYVESMVVEYNVIHTHQKDESAYYAPHQPTCQAGNVEYWDCTCSECTAKLDANANVIEDVIVPPILEHSVSRYSVTKSATCSTPGQKAGRCDVCGAPVTVEIPIDPTAHVLGGYSVKTRATCSTKGEEIAECSVCKASFSREIPKNPNAHVYASEWSFDDTHHWHEPECECGVIADYAAHNRDLTKSGYPCRVCGAEMSWWASTLSEGNIWIVCVLGAAAVIAVGAIVITKKKRKSASAQAEQ